MLAFAFSNISIPPMIPLIIFTSLQIGSYFVKGDGNFLAPGNFTFETIKNNSTQYIVGSFILATIAAFSFGLGSFFLLSLTRKTKK